MGPENTLSLRPGDMRLSKQYVLGRISLLEIGDLINIFLGLSLM